MLARAHLAASYRQAGRTSEAITIEKQVVADRERLLGDHPDTVTAAATLEGWKNRYIETYKQPRLRRFRAPMI